ncbi:MAG: serine hydrolase [Myxococcales bacterium]|nr:serine hydrolase [Myxococcales bacterium]
MLSHQAGMFNVRDLIDDARRLLDRDHMVEALAAAPATAVPPGATAYQALTYGFLVGEVLRRTDGRRTDGRTVPRFLADEPAGPSASTGSTSARRPASCPAPRV